MAKAKASPRKKAAPPAGAVSRALLAWYGRHRRHLPWRAAPGRRADPYRVWLSEIMLQQTTVATVRGYFEKFLARWPRVEDLAAARLDQVLHAWQGLGYYARARNLHRCAQSVVADHGGVFPADEARLRALPGIGAYTAAAIAAIAFGARANAVDGNIERVVARLFAVTSPLPGAKQRLQALAATLLPARNCGDYLQAMMDLGATICTPRAPQCPVCPLRALCAVAGTALAQRLPRRAPKTKRPRRHGVAFVAIDRHGAILLRRRPERGLLGGMMEVPSTEWRAAPWDLSEARVLAPIKAVWRAQGRVRHVFTHFELVIEVMSAPTPRVANIGLWVKPGQMHGQALPTVMKKIILTGGPRMDVSRPTEAQKI